MSKNKGIYEKYHVLRRDDATGKHDNCFYFVLDLDHDRYSRPALRAYAKACMEEYPLLARDILTKLQE